jgi:Ca2+:H+ antiporter
MIAGGIKYKEQQFNPTAAAISSLLLFVAVIGAFTPTIFYHIFGQYTSNCQECIILPPRNDTHGVLGINASRIFCMECHYGQDSMKNDPLYQDAVKNLLYLSCGVLPAAYLIGLFFTFKTHTHIFDEEEEEEEGSAEWTIAFSAIVMIISISCFGLLAEDVVELLQEVLETLGLNQAFLGITVIALTPAATEIANAIKFALSNQISLSVSIGSASSIQVVLIQMPSLVFLAAIFAGDSGFHLIFPLMSVFAVILAVLAFNYISSEGKTNYFVGSSMVIMYILLIASFYFIPDVRIPPLYPKNDTSPPHHFSEHVEYRVTHAR